MKNIKQFLCKYLISILAFNVQGIVWGIFDLDLFDWTFEKNLKNICIAAFLVGLGAFFVETVFFKKIRELEKKNQKVLYILGKIAAYAGVFAFADFIIYCRTLKGYEEFIGLNATRISAIADRIFEGACFLMIALGIFFLYIQKAYRREAFSFSTYIARVFSNLSKIFIVFVVLALGGQIVTSVISEWIFSNRISLDTFYADYILIGFLIPAVIYALVEVEKETGKLMNVIMKYILPVLAFCILLTAYGYVLKILIAGKIPSNEVYDTITTIFCFVTPVWIMAEHYTEETVYSKIVSVIPYVFAPLIILQIYSIGVRIYSYSMTRERYMGVMFILFEILTIVIGTIWKKHREVILLALAVLVVITLWAPGINAFTVSNMCQFKILKENYEKVNEGYAITDEEYSKLWTAYQYLHIQEETESICADYDIHSDEFKHKLAESEATVPVTVESFSMFVDSFNEKLDISEYSTMSIYKMSSEYYPHGKKLAYDDIDYENFEFVHIGTGRKIFVDISEFVDRCIELSKEDVVGDAEYAQRIGDGNFIILDENRTFCIQSVSLSYREGVNEEGPFFEWISFNVDGVLLEKK